MNKQSGFAVVEAVLIIVVVAGLAGGGYIVWHRQQKTVAPIVTTTTTTSSYVSPPVTTQSVPAVNSPVDLNIALTTLNQTDVGASTSDSTQLGSQSQGF